MRARRISDINPFLRQLATLITAGIPLVQCFEILSQDTHLKTLLLTIKRDLAAGHSLSKAFKKHPRYFNDTTCYLIETGEISGSLDTLLTRLATDREKHQKLQHQIKRALIYPSMIILTSLLTIGIMLTYVIPRFQELFQSAHADLPALTQSIITLSQWIREKSWLLVLVSITGTTALIVAHRTQSTLTSYWLKTPLKKVLLTQFASTLATLLASGIPLLDALKISTQQSRNPRYTHAMAKLHIQIRAGRQLHTAMRSDSLFPDLMIQMVKVGEESGQLELMLNKTAELYQADIDCLINNLSQIIEPLIIIVLGALIGGMVIAMYLPIFKLGTVI